MTFNAQLSRRDIIFIIIRIFIGGFFLYTGFSKIFFLSGFADEIYYYRVFPSFIIGISAVFMPFYEIVLGIFFIIGLWFKATLSLLILNLFAFVILISSALIRGLDISCGCFGYGEGNLVNTLIMDIIMIFLLLKMFFAEKHKFLLDNLLNRPYQDS